MVDGDRHGRREERLARRSDLKHGVGIDRLTVLAADSEALGVHDLVADDDADCEPWNVEGLHVRRDVVLDRGNDRKHLLLCRGILVLGGESAVGGRRKQDEGNRRLASRAA